MNILVGFLNKKNHIKFIYLVRYSRKTADGQGVFLHNAFQSNKITYTKTCTV